MRFGFGTKAFAILVAVAFCFVTMGPSIAMASEDNVPVQGGQSEAAGGLVEGGAALVALSPLVIAGIAAGVIAVTAVALKAADNDDDDTTPSHNTTPVHP